jgi:DNA-binding IclR family transcriptional regulator
MVRGPDGSALAAVSVAMPTARFVKAELPDWAGRLATTAGQIEAVLR